MIRVSEIEGQACQVLLTLREPLESHAETTAIKIAPQRQPRLAMKDAREMIGRAAQGFRHVAQRGWTLDVLVDQELGGLDETPVAPPSFEPTTTASASEELVGTPEQVIDKVEDEILDGQWCDLTA